MPTTFPVQTTTDPDIPSTYNAVCMHLCNSDTVFVVLALCTGLKWIHEYEVNVQTVSFNLRAFTDSWQFAF